MVYIIIPVFNRINLTKNCLLLLAKQTISNIHIIVIDDGSKDKTSQMVQNEFPEAELIQGSGNWYWTGSVYKGVERALKLSSSDKDYILMLNDDLEFSPNLIQNLINFSTKHPKSIVQALGSWTNQPKIIQYAGMKINWWTAKGFFPYEGALRQDFSPTHFESSDTLTGRGVLFPIQVFRQVGNYDRRIIHRGDPELTRRAAKAGWNLFVYFGAVVFSVPVKGKGNINEQKCYHLANLKEYYFGSLSSSHIPTLWRNSCSYTHSKIQAFIFFSCTLARHSVHFIKNLYFNPKEKK